MEDLPLVIAGPILRGGVGDIGVGVARAEERGECGLDGEGCDGGDAIAVADPIGTLRVGETLHLAFLTAVPDEIVRAATDDRQRRFLVAERGIDADQANRTSLASTLGTVIELAGEIQRVVEQGMQSLHAIAALLAGSARAFEAARSLDTVGSPSARGIGKELVELLVTVANGDLFRVALRQGSSEARAVRGHFAPAQFFERREEDKLAAAPYQLFDAGAELTGVDGVVFATWTGAEVSYEAGYVDDEAGEDVRPEIVVEALDRFRVAVLNNARANSVLGRWAGLPVGLR